jgi:NAD(P)-dependent dehydrogenase (short-subunit alcohol dehydrogenase family)
LTTEWTDPDANDVPDYASMLRLDGQVHVVLGGGFGIGYQTSHALSSVGATVVCVDRDEERAVKVAAEVEGIPWTGDITDRDAMSRLFDFVGERCGLTDEDWLFHHEVVLKHAYLALEYAAKYWQRTGTGGSVTFVASVAGLTSAPKTSAYAAQKAALMSLMRTAAVELGPDGIRVNAVAPGVVRTPRQQVNPKWTPDLLESNIAKTPLRRLAYPSDIAKALLFLSSPLASHVTGQTLVVDGGNSIVFNVDVPNP